MMVHAQTICPSTQGYNAVWGTKSPSCTTLEVVGSDAFIDASAWCGGDCSQQDFCTMVNFALLQLQSVSPAGGVVDARGVVTTTPPLKCASNPFSGITVPSTVLLPPLRIQPQKPWILPSNTRISGQSQQTNLQAFPSFVADSTNAMIEMGAAPGSTGVVVEHLQLDGSVQSTGSETIGVGGIYNGNAQDGSYVNDVTFYAMGALTSTQSPMTTGLLVDTGAAGSGPYTNIVFSGPHSTNCNNNSVTCKPTAAVQLRAATRGLHGIRPCWLQPRMSSISTNMEIYTNGLVINQRFDPFRTYLRILPSYTRGLVFFDGELAIPTAFFQFRGSGFNHPTFVCLPDFHTHPCELG
jgi:hypothetical protein